MYIANLVVLALFSLILLIILGLSFTRWSTERAAYKLATSVGIGLTEEFLPPIRSRLALQQRGATIGGLVGMLTAALLLLNDSELARSSFGSLTYAGIAITALTVGGALTAARPHSHLHPDRPRLARASVVTMADYVAPLERKGTFIAVTIAVATALIFVTGGPGVIDAATPLWLSGPVILAALSVASLVLFEVVGRRILRRGQPAGSPTELAWDDALRSQRLRSLITAPLILSAYGAFSGLTELSQAYGSAHSPAIALTFAIATMLLACAVLVVALRSLIIKPQRFFLRRLWPDAEGAA